MRCPSCKKKVVFGSISAAAWKRVHAEEWLYSARAPKAGQLGDCPVCGARLEWEPGEALPTGMPTRVHLSALRESPGNWTGRDVWLRALVIEKQGAAFLSDSWRSRAKSGEPEDDRTLVDRLEREQLPPILVRFAMPELRAQFEESSRRLSTGTLRCHAAWVEAEGVFDASPVDGTRMLVLRSIASIWPPKD